MKINEKDTKSDILRKIEGLSTGERYTFFSNGVLSAIDIFTVLLGNLDGNIKATILTWQLGIRHAEKLKQLIKRYDLDFRLLLDVSYENRNPDYFRRVRNMLGDVIWLTKNHSKIMVVESEKLHYCVLSSANFNRNFRYEFFDITESKYLCLNILTGVECFFNGDPISKDPNNRGMINDDFENFFKEEPKKIIHNVSPMLRSRKKRSRIFA